MKQKIHLTLELVDGTLRGEAEVSPSLTGVDSPEFETLSEEQRLLQYLAMKLMLAFKAELDQTLNRLHTH